MDKTPIITITPVAYVDMILAVESCPVEVSGLGDIEHEGNEWKATSIVVIPQRCSAGGTKFDPLAHNLYIARLLKEGRRAEADLKKLWWHSHVLGPALFSMIDDHYINRVFGRNVPRSAQNPWLLSIVGNKYRQLGVRLDIFRPERLTYDRLPIHLSPNPGRDALRELYYARRTQIGKTVRELVTILPSHKERKRNDTDEEEIR